MIRRCPARSRTHDALRPTLTLRARSCPPAIDVGTLTSEQPMRLPADPVRLDLTSCVACPRCSASPIPAASLANVFPKRNYPVDTFPPNRADRAFTDRIRLGASKRRPQDLKPQRPHGIVKVFGEDAIAIMNQIAVGAFIPNHLSHLL